MNKSFILIEFNQISKSYEILNDILLNYPVKIFLSKNICPGRILFILEGFDSDLISINIFCKDNHVNSDLVLNISKDIIKIINKNPSFKNFSSLFVLESKNSITAIKAADICNKYSNINLLKIQINLGLFGKGLFFAQGELSSTKQCSKLISKFFNENDIINTSIIERPTQELLKII
ncbi:MAG: BMC domain protein [Peptoniphilus sp.]|uniref:BMC domain protein n=1 Tax=Peptoniphilus sp. TaxID=1971214 RepID=UPI002A75C9C6|nr:BMC domain protein [Peptoniphilus sp.]MDY2987879.1 BMC domain protein [Peptoniphilus sp.]